MNNVAFLLKELKMKQELGQANAFPLMCNVMAPWSWPQDGVKVPIFNYDYTQSYISIWKTVRCKAFGPDILKISEILRIIATFSEQNACDFQKVVKISN